MAESQNTAATELELKAVHTENESSSNRTSSLQSHAHTIDLGRDKSGDATIAPSSPEKSGVVLEDQTNLLPPKQASESTTIHQ